MANVDVDHIRRISTFRRIALGTWGTPADPSIYGVLKIRMERSLAYIEEAQQRTGRRLTVTHLVTKALGEALVACPQANVLLRWGRLYQRRSVDVSVLVLTGDPKSPDLSSAMLRAVDTRSVLDIADGVEAQAKQIRGGKNAALERTRSSLGKVPGLLMRLVLRLVAFVSYTLNLDLSRFGVPRDAFGSAIVTSLGSLGIEMAFVPLVPYSRVSIVLAPGRVTDEPVVDAGHVVTGKVMNLSATFDHRVIDGAHASVIASTLRQVLEDPFTHLPLPETNSKPRATAPSA